MRKLSPLVVVALALVPTACGVDISVGTVVNVPAASLDLDTTRTVLEGRLCADAGSDGCAVLGALDVSDGEATSPAAFPEVMPQYIEIERFGATAIDVERWFVDDAIPDADVDLLPGRLVRIDEGFADDIDDDTLDGIGIDAVALVVSGNRLTLDVPEYELWVGSGASEDEAGVVVADRDAAVLFARSEGCQAGVDAAAPVWLADGATDALKGALRAGGAWMELRSTEQVPDLQLGEELRTLVRPGGTADVAVELRLQVPVKVAALRDQLEQQQQQQ